MCTEAAVIANMNDDVTECFKVPLCIELFQQPNTMAPKQLRVLRAEIAPLGLILTVTINMDFINVNQLDLLIVLYFS